MDEKFLEFWGHLLLNAAKSKKQTDELTRWLRMGLPGMTTPPASKKPSTDFEEMIATFRKLYGLDQVSEKDQDPQKTWANALKDFQKSFQDYLSVYGVVSKKEHLALVEKYEKLKARCIDQEETIRHLRMLLEDRKEEQSNTATQLQDIVRSQGELFQKMVTDFSQYFGSEKPTPENRTHMKKEKEEDDDPPDRPERDV